jgi:hypothetical protein
MLIPPNGRLSTWAAMWLHERQTFKRPRRLLILGALHRLRSLL